MFVFADRLYQTLVDIIHIPSTSGHEEQVRTYLEGQLANLGLTSQVDSSGNLIAFLAGEGKPILLNAHMDRVPPGLGHEPILQEGTLYSDGTTNLGADDAAGITVILEVLRRVIEQELPHPPLVIVFTVQEETGLCGANGFDGSQWNVSDGIIFDNAFEAGIVVSKGSAYEAFDITISGKSGHPGKDLTKTVNAIEIFRQTRFPHGSLALDQTRILIGQISGGQARNAIPDTVQITGEIRSFEAPEIRQKYRNEIQEAFEEAAQRLGGRVNISFHPHSDGYSISPDEPLLHTYQVALSQRGAVLQMQPTFIGSDTSGFRPQIQAFTVSTGVVNEHTVEEYVALAPLEQLVIDTLQVLHLWYTQTIPQQ
ncbi:MAG TPA: M20/M25/M40 family metallo-hydrolase [Dictyobacter sp.]|jgi:tripeptide aminopeptidase|nr:M20/M25/M40 family metallo-hydrolase [Dictyobacter sp.]